MIRLAVECDATDAESVLAALLDLVPAGVEEQRNGASVEFAVYGAPGELPSMPRGEARVAGRRVTVSGREVGDDWAERWREFHRPALVGGRVFVRPPWEAPAADAIDVSIDPGAAFGTGAHATTRLCIELLLEGEKGGSLVDLGCGSGVLAIAAAKLGFDPVAAIDSERAAIDAARANCAANRVSVGLDRLDLRADAVPWGRTIVANLTAPVLRQLARRLTEAGGDAEIATPRFVIASGLVEGELRGIEPAFAAAGFRLAERRALDGWEAARFVATGGGEA